MTLSRRNFIRQTGVGLLTFSFAGCERDMSPAEARREGVPYSVLSAEEVAVVDALGEALAPGSSAAGVSHYLDHQLAADPGDSMLMIRYLGVPAPYTGFYRAGLAAASALSQTSLGSSVDGLDESRLSKLVATIAGAEVDAWQGPPPGFFYFVLRSDAADVAYGTLRGFESLGVPYNPHITPPSPWGS